MFPLNGENESDLDKHGEQKKAEFLITFAKVCSSLLMVLLTILPCFIFYVLEPSLAIFKFVFLAILINIFVHSAIWRGEGKGCASTLVLLISIPAWLILMLLFIETGHLPSYWGILGAVTPLILLVALNLLINASIWGRKSTKVRVLLKTGMVLLVVVAVSVVVVYATAGLRPAVAIGM